MRANTTRVLKLRMLHGTLGTRVPGVDTGYPGTCRVPAMSAMPGLQEIAVQIFGAVSV